jgi:hypothetical protein
MSGITTERFDKLEQSFQAMSRVMFRGQLNRRGGFPWRSSCGFDGTIISCRVLPGTTHFLRVRFYRFVACIAKAPVVTCVP